MLPALVSAARRLLKECHRFLLRSRGPAHRPRPSPVSPPVPRYEPLRRVVLTDGVGRTLFDEFLAHRRAARGEEETGWLLLGVRTVDEVVALATLPAGTQRDAGLSHVLFNSTAQAVGSRIVRHKDRRLSIVGVVHTHPGSLRHPSDADYDGDSEWVTRLRGEEGVFGIGTAEEVTAERGFVTQPRPNAQCLGDLRFTWYALHQNDARYRPLSVGLTLGPDLAHELHPLWPVLEEHAEQLERLYRQQAGMTIALAPEHASPALIVTIPLAEPGQAVRVVLKEKQVRYYLLRDQELLAADCFEERVDQGVYLLLAALAAQA